MSDYSQITDFSAKDALTTGDSEKIISGADVDAEFAAISTAIATKYDSNDVASQAQAEAETSNAVLITPLRLGNWADANGGMVGDIHALADPGADTLLGWDDSAGAAISFSIGDGLETSGTTLQLPATLAGAGLTISSGVLAVGGGAGITANANDVALTDAGATTSNPVDVTSGAITLDLTALTTISASGLAAGDLILVDDGGTPKALKVEEAGMRVQPGQTTQTLAASDMNTIMEFTGTATLTLPASGLPVGVPVVVNVKNATQELTVTAAASTTLVSTYHPGGTVAASDIVKSGGSALIYQTATGVWCITGDIKDS